mgnify:CR=1 FL=1
MSHGKRTPFLFKTFKKKKRFKKGMIIDIIRNISCVLFLIIWSRAFVGKKPPVDMIDIAKFSASNKRISEIIKKTNIIDVVKA